MRTKIPLLTAVLLPVLSLQAIVDTNENGLSDLWEKQHNDNELFPETFDPDADSDADGWSNAQEAAAGTNPFSTAHPDGHLQPETTHIPETWVPFQSLVVMHDEIPNDPENYKPVRINSLRFPNNDGVDEKEKFSVDGEGTNMWHYHNEFGEKRLMINASKSDLPSKLRYNTFFYNACSSGIDYIENFRHGNFLFTTDTCAVYQGTKVFVKGGIDGKTPRQIIPLLNQPLIESPDEGVIIYQLEEFKN